MSNLDWQIFGLVGAAQASETLKDFLNTKGFLEQNQFNAMVRSILVTQSDSLEDIYGKDLSLWRRGKFSLTGYLAQVNSLNSEEFYYFMSILKLAKKMLNNKNNMRNISDIVSTLQWDIHNRNTDFEGVLETLNTCYKDYISSLKFRIKVQIQRDMNFDVKQEARMRTILFAGLRSAVLWRQGGGTLPSLLFQREKILARLEEVFAKN